MRSPIRPLSVALLVLGLSVTACGGSDDSGSADSSSSSAPADSPTPTPSPSEDPQLTGLEAQAIGLDVADYAVNHNFTNPTDQADFEAKVDYQKDLKPGSKVAYVTVPPKGFNICVTHSAGGETTSWGIFDAKSGKATSGAGAPTEDFCP